MSSPLSAVPDGISGVAGSKGKEREPYRLNRSPGMEKGYNASPMAALRTEYLTDAEQEYSLGVRVKTLIEKTELDPRDIIDRGLTLDKVSLPRLGLETGFAMRLDSTLKDLQTIIRQAAQMVPARATHFIVDPDLVLFNVLRGANSLSEIATAWSGLRRRLELGEEYLKKYDKEFQAEFNNQLPTSPVSTNPDLYDVLKQDNLSNHQKLDRLFDIVPHYGELMPDAYREASRTQTMQFGGWIPPSDVLLQAFPDRQAESSPAVVYYSLDGQRREHATTSRSSWKQGEGFVLPKKAEDSSRRRVMIREPASTVGKERRAARTGGEWERDISVSYPRVDTATEPSEAGSGRGRDVAELTNQYSFLGSRTPFKKAEDFFVPRSPRGPSSVGAVPGPNLPNTLYGIAAGPSSVYHSFGESASQVHRGDRDHRYDEWTSASGVERRSRANTPTGSAARQDSSNPGRAEGFESDKDERQETREEEPRRNARSQRHPQAPRGGPEDLSDDKSSSDDDDCRDGGFGAGKDGNDNPRRPPAREPDRGHRRREPYYGPPGPPGLPDGGGSGSQPVRKPELGNGPVAPYGTVMPTIEPKLKIESLPEWDGQHSTAIDYFWEIGQLATLGGWLPEALAYWLPQHLKKGSVIQAWFSMQSSVKQAQMRSHYMVYLQTIKDKYLGQRWQLQMNIQFKQQAFRQEGHERETPQEFIIRRIRYTRMLANSDDGGPLEVYLAMRKAPLHWNTILVMENIHSTEELFDKINDHADSLVDAHRDSSGYVSTSSLASGLRKLGVNLETLKQSGSRRVNFTIAEDDIQEAETKLVISVQPWRNL
ncbi:hypothetical protein C8J57DRAFT_1523486 [Mycena rebaudengoi]|nr:hypothetical protein C8J57DRAFT_1523486 [Mycena rebaudengoi]